MRSKINWGFRDNWLSTTFVICAVLGVFMITQGKVKVGAGYVISAFAGLFIVPIKQYLMMHPQIPTAIAAVGAVIGMGWLLWRLFVKDRIAEGNSNALKDVVVGGEQFKKYNPEQKIGFNLIQSENQSFQTRDIVKEIKEQNGG